MLKEKGNSTISKTPKQAVMTTNPKKGANAIMKT